MIFKEKLLYYIIIIIIIMQIKYNIENYMYETENKTNPSLIYGETDHNKLIYIIKKLEKTYNITNFIDIGSGCGNLIIHLSSAFPYIYFEGIEIQKNRFEESLRKRDEINNSNLYVFNTSFYNEYIGNYDFLYCCNTIFSDDDNKKLYEKILNEFKGICILFTNPPCLLKYFIDQDFIGSSWHSHVPIYIYYL